MLLSENLRNILEDKLAKLNKLRPISSAMLAKLKERFEIEMTYNSNAIEGNSLTLKETFWVIQEGITVKGKSLKDHLEAKNHKEALDYLYELVNYKNPQTFSENLIKSLHGLVMQDIDKAIAGKYRNVDVFITGTEHTPPSALVVPAKMHELVNWARKESKKTHIIDFAAIIHHKFVHIHPFEDGNGRVGRLLVNIFLMQHGFPLTIIQKNDRQKYYRVLQDADKGNYKPLIILLAQAVLRSLSIYLDALTPSNQKEDLITLRQAAGYVPYSQAYLGKIAKEGKIDAVKLKRNWMTTKEAVLRYFKSKNKV